MTERQRTFVHIYCGEGKGKTTAAVGLSLRALGAGLRVCFAQFLKCGQSGEIALLEKLGAAVLCQQDVGDKFWYDMTDDEKRACEKSAMRLLTSALDTPCDLLVLDEACAAAAFGIIKPGDLLPHFHGARELVITGRAPDPLWLDNADYITRMECVRHPFSMGVQARRGIEY